MPARPPRVVAVPIDRRALLARAPARSRGRCRARRRSPARPCPRARSLERLAAPARATARSASANALQRRRRCAWSGPPAPCPGRTRRCASRPRPPSRGSISTQRTGMRACRASASLMRCGLALDRDVDVVDDRNRRRARTPRFCRYAAQPLGRRLQQRRMERRAHRQHAPRASRPRALRGCRRALDRGLVARDDHLARAR